MTGCARGRKQVRPRPGKMRAHCRGLVVALCVLALVPVAADSRQDRERADWLEASNKALERELALARAELLERAGGRAFEDDAGGAGGGDREGSVKDLSSKLEQMGAEVERLTTINAELRQLLDQEQGGDGGLDGVEGGKEALALADADVRLEMHTKVVGSSPKSKDDESFLLDLATAKLAQGDLGTAAGLYRSHLALFTGTAAARSAAARRMLLLMQGHARSRAGRHLASHMVADKSSAQVCTCACVCARACVRARLRACVHACVFVRVFVCVYVCYCACTRDSGDGGADVTRGHLHTLGVRAGAPRHCGGAGEGGAGGGESACSVGATGAISLAPLVVGRRVASAWAAAGARRETGGGALVLSAGEHASAPGCAAGS